MAQWVSAAKHDNLSSIPGSYMVGRVKRPLKVVLGPPHVHVCAHTYTHISFKNLKGN